MGYLICILVTGIITYLVSYVLGYDAGYAKGRRDERNDWIKLRNEEIKERCRNEAAQRRMKGGQDGEESRADSGE